MILATITSYGASVPMGFAKSLMRMGAYDHIWEQGCYLDINRNNVFERARIENQDLLFIDSDIVFTPEDVKKIEEHLKTKDVVTGVCVMSFPGWPASIFNDQLKPMTITSDEPFEVFACGSAFMGISKKVLNDLAEPFNPIDYSHGKKHGEDISFCLRAREAGYKIWCDPTVRVGHIKAEAKYYGLS